MNADPKVVVITGAASGIGYALTEICLQRGFQVMMADNAALLLGTKVEILSKRFNTKVLGFVCDVSKFSEVKELAETVYSQYGRIDWLINNAGVIGPLAPFWELSLQQIHDVMNINLHGTIHGIQAFLPILFKQTHDSHIINMSSVFGLCSSSQMAAYAMSKQAIIALSESLFFDLKRLAKPVNISVVCPSFTNTALLENSLPLNANSFQSRMRDLIAHGRSPEDIALHIVQEVENKRFYILPDKEVKNDYEQRSAAIIEQTDPHQHSLERIIAALSKKLGRK